MTHDFIKIQGSGTRGKWHRSPPGADRPICPVGQRRNNRLKRWLRRSTTPLSRKICEDCDKEAEEEE